MHLSRSSQMKFSSLYTVRDIWQGHNKWINKVLCLQESKEMPFWKIKLFQLLLGRTFKMPCLNSSHTTDMMPKNVRWPSWSIVWINQLRLTLTDFYYKRPINHFSSIRTCWPFENRSFSKDFLYICKLVKLNILLLVHFDTNTFVLLLK